LAKFIVLYNAPMSASEQMASATPEQRQAGMDAWMAWMQQAGNAALDMGAPMQAVSSFTANGKSASSSQASGYSILQADSQEQIEQLLNEHPHLKTPGGSIEVFEVLSMPGS
jgi:hypothetical protein